jgi:hypothetical protein
MAKPLPVSDTLRAASNGPQGRPGDRRAEGRDPRAVAVPDSVAGPDDLQEMERLRDENTQLRSLCLELEQALQEVANRPTGEDAGGSGNEQLREYEALLEERSETIRLLHQHVEELEAALSDAESRAGEAGQPGGTDRRPPGDGPAPREEELLALSEQLEQERRQLQEDEQTLMDQMREMEVGMARERAELARQRNDLQRLQGEIRHELERLERNGALQSKIDNLKSKLQDVTARRGAARIDAVPGQAGSAAPPNVPPPPPPAAGPPGKGQGLMGRLFGQGGR